MTWGTTYALVALALGGQPTGDGTVTPAVATKVAEAPPPAGSDADAEAPPGAKPPTVAEAKRVLARPRGSLSLGGTGRGGRLVDAVELPLTGPSWQVLKHARGRQTNFGTVELVELIKRASAAVKRETKRAVLRLGNMGFEKGGKLPWSVSHQSGRDVDVAFYVSNSAGKTAKPSAFVRMGANGRSTDKRGRYRFDVRRNLAFVRALIADTDAPVQWIFVAEHLKQRLIAQARRSDVPADLIERMEAVLHQPSDSNPHDDHFHIRIYCSIEDRLHGCLNWGPRRPWVDLGDEAYQARVDSLVRLLSLDRPRYRRRALEALQAIHARSAADAMIAHLDDRSPRVRRAALAALKTVAAPASAPGIVAAMKRTGDARWAAELLRSLYRLPHELVVRTAEGVLARPRDFLSEDVAAKPQGRFHRIAADILGRYGRKTAVPVLIELLSSRERKVRSSAHDALLRVTNQRVRGRIESSSRRRRQKVIDAWRRFHEQRQDDSWLQWMRLGFEQRGYRFKGRMMRARSIPTLIRAVGHRDLVVSHNAIRVLGELTGHVVEPSWRTTRNNVRHWNTWWRKNKARFTQH